MDRIINSSKKILEILKNHILHGFLWYNLDPLKKWYYNLYIFPFSLIILGINGGTLIVLKMQNN